MTAKEKALARHKEFLDSLSGVTNSQDCYLTGYFDGAKDFARDLEEDNILVFPGYGTPVFKLIWVRTKRTGYFSRPAEHRTIITSVYTLKAALEDGDIVIENRAFCRTDILGLGKFTFETREEAEAALAEYRKNVPKD